MGKNKIVILGHRGFVGGYLYNQFSKNPDWETKGFSSQEVDLLKEEQTEGFFRGLDSNSVLIFCAAIGRTRQDDVESFLKNIVMTAHVAGGLKKYPLRHCLFLSSIDVYGLPKQLPLTESSPTQPNTCYGWSKLAGEFLLREALAAAPTVLTILRLSGVYGRGERSGNPINVWVRAAMEKGRVELFGDGTERRDYVWLHDLYLLLRRFIASPKGGVFNGVTGKSHSLLEIIGQLRETVSKPVEVVRSERRRPWLDYQFDVGNLQKAIGPFSFTPLSVGLKQLCEKDANR